MVALTDTIKDITGETVSGDDIHTAFVRSPTQRPSYTGQGLVSTRPVKISDGGELALDLEPGPAVLVVLGPSFHDTWELYVEEGQSTIRDAVAAVPGVLTQHEVSVLRTLLDGAEEAADTAGTAAGTATTAAQQAGQDRTLVQQIRDLLEEAYNDSAAGFALPPRLTESALSATYAGKGANTYTGRQTVPSIQLTTQTDAITLRDTLGTHGRRLSIEPADPLGDRAVQMQIIPGETVSQDTTDQVIQSQILMFGRIGADYERLLIDGRGKEFRVTTSKRDDGTVRPLVFQIEDNGVSLTQVASIRPGGQFRVHGVLQFGSAGDASMSRIAAGVIQTPGEFRAGTSVRAASGTAQEIQFGNVGGFGTATAIFGGDSFLIRSGANYLRTMGGFRIDGELRHQGSTVGFFNAPPTAKPTGVATTASAIHAALVSLGLIGA